MQGIENLGEEEAALAVATIREELIRRGKVAVIAVSDAYGELVSLLRMDGAPLPSVRIAAKKCRTSARERAPSGEVNRNYVQSGVDLSGADPDFIGWDGGVPVRRAGKVVGAVAVSGLDQAEDAELSRMAVAKIEERLGA
jgi:uncharacterized protein GlcG (DUF336 family)